MTRVATSCLPLVPLLQSIAPSGWYGRTSPASCQVTEDADFGAFLGMLGQLGYGFAYRVLDAQYFGVAQRRRRVFVVGCLGDWRSAAAVLFERHSLQGHPAPRRSKDQSLTLATANDQVLAVHEVVGSMCAESGPNTHGSRGVSGSQTLMSGYCQPTIGMQVRRLTPRECERLQGFPDDYTLVPWRGNMSADGPRYKALGNSWAVPVVRWIGERIELVQSVM
jgi:DNA (cytosine-5)-methyltransferase 1